MEPIKKEVFALKELDDFECRVKAGFERVNRSKHKRTPFRRSTSERRASVCAWADPTIAVV